MNHRIVVLGAGYAGLGAAKRAARTAGRDAEVTLVNASDRFVERVRLHQLASGGRLDDLPLAGLLDGTGVDLVVARATGLDLDARRVRLGDGRALGYDTLVYALGSAADLDAVPGAREHAFAVAGAAGAERLRDRLPGLGSVAVIGGGLTGIETAAELAEARPGLRVDLVTAGPLGASLGPRARRYLHRTFERLGVAVHENAPVAKVAADGLLLEDGRELPADAAVWAAGFRVPPLAAEAGLGVDERGRVRVDETLRAETHPDVIAVGDAATLEVRGRATRMSCQIGLPMGLHGGNTAAALARGREPARAKPRYVGQCVSLGRRDALVQFSRTDDTPIARAVLTGRAAARTKEAIVRGTVFAMRRPELVARSTPGVR
ncbi:NAD(P)/FAD-dependent oxidoreductase [Actinomadura algeriensis]|uniref:NADH dehydrogenase FAD-containing subunit n=1 Tax=Actinomadura algeriensis TaxID=1679523 RepID=A0ABR9K3U3_9ACTN|nr:FAD-dependent oxidoreductase [Actinomadura algeriensis]MBE1537514.1 NADH dehydrogenase FAD-containing subunit [Actinomadura algeriensis]